MSFAIDDHQRRRILTNTRALFSLTNILPHEFDIITGARQNGHFASVIAYNQHNSNPKVRILHRMNAKSEVEAVIKLDEEVAGKVDEAFKTVPVGAAWDASEKCWTV